VSLRVVLRLNVRGGSGTPAEFFQYLQSVKDALERAEQLGAGPRSKVHYTVNEGGEPVMTIDLPEKLSEARVPRPKEVVRTKAQQAVADRRATRQAAVEAGEAVPGHEPPIVKGGKVLRKRKRPQ
jgi:SLT domain-containing protein